MKEIWKPVIGQKSNYEVSNIGRVRSLDRFINHPYSKNGKNYVKGRTLSLIKQNHGYYCVSIDGDKTTVHSLVAAAFIGKRPPGFHVDHINKIRTDNRVENLRYLSAIENSIHEADDHPKTKLTSKQVIEMRSLFNSGMRVCDIARKFKLRNPTAWLIVHKYNWKKLKETA